MAEFFTIKHIPLWSCEVYASEAKITCGHSTHTESLVICKFHLQHALCPVVD
jgi:hypothetical protein